MTEMPWIKDANVYGVSVPGKHPYNIYISIHPY